jgi:hypothetical protein
MTMMNEEKKIFCMNCEQVVFFEDVFCSNCGEQVQESLDKARKELAEETLKLVHERTKDRLISTMLLELPSPMEKKDFIALYILSFGFLWLLSYVFFIIILGTISNGIGELPYAFWMLISPLTNYILLYDVLDIKTRHFAENCKHKWENDGSYEKYMQDPETDYFKCLHCDKTKEKYNWYGIGP